MSDMEDDIRAAMASLEAEPDAAPVDEPVVGGSRGPCCKARHPRPGFMVACG